MSDWHTDQNKQDTIFDSVILSDFLLISSSVKETFFLHYLLDGTALFPALIVLSKLTNKIGISIITTYEKPHLLIILISLCQLLRPFSVSNLHSNFFATQLNNPSKTFFTCMVISPPIFILFCILPLF